MHSTTSSSLPKRPCSASASAAATVAPPAVSVKMPVVSASRRMAATMRVVAHRRGPAAGAAHRARGKHAVRRISDGDRLRDRVRDLRYERFATALHEPRDRCASGCLRAVQSRRLVLHEPRVANLAERLVQLREQRAASHRHDHRARESPSQLLGDLEAHRLRALAIVAAQIHVDDSPSESVGELRAQTIHIIVVCRARARDSVRTPRCRAPSPARDCPE